MTTKRWIWIFAVIAIICIGALFYPLLSDHGSIVTIAQDGHVLHTIDLSRVTEPYELTIPYGEHYNIVAISPNEVYVKEADCSNQVCVNHGVLQQSGAPIICLPHRLIISWAESGVDA